RARRRTRRGARGGRGRSPAPAADEDGARHLRDAAEHVDDLLRLLLRLALLLALPGAGEGLAAARARGARARAELPARDALDDDPRLALAAVLVARPVRVVALPARDGRGLHLRRDGVLAVAAQDLLPVVGRAAARAGHRFGGHPGRRGSLRGAPHRASCPA